MPLVLNHEELWERIKRVEGKPIPRIERKRIFRVVKVVNERVCLQDADKDKIQWLPQNYVWRCYEHVKKHGKYTSKDRKTIKVPASLLARIIALLAFAIPEEIVAFTQDQGEHLFGERLRGIRKKDC